MRVVYVGLALVTIAAGMLVHFATGSAGSPLRDALGDALWAVMMFWLLGAAAPRALLAVRAGGAYLICACVETSQLYHSPSLDAVRATRPGHLVLGSGFDSRDFLWYVLGVGGTMILEIVARKTMESSRARQR